MLTGPLLPTPRQEKIEPPRPGRIERLLRERGKPWEAVLSWGIGVGDRGPDGDADPHPGAQRATHRHWIHRPTALIACLPRFAPLSFALGIAKRSTPNTMWDRVGHQLHPQRPRRMRHRLINEVAVVS